MESSQITKYVWVIGNRPNDVSDVFHSQTVLQNQTEATESVFIVFTFLSNSPSHNTCTQRKLNLFKNLPGLMVLFVSCTQLCFGHWQSLEVMFLDQRPENHLD